MSSALKTELLPHYTYDDYIQWEGRWEIIYGVPYAMSPQPAFEHQQLSAKIASELGAKLKKQSVYLQVLPIDWQITEDTVVQPDNLVVKGRPTGSKLTEAPVIIFEIISPSTAAKDRKLKYQLYQNAGVKYYVIADPSKQCAEIFELIYDTDIDDKNYKFVMAASGNDEFTFKLDEFSFIFSFSEIW